MAENTTDERTTVTVRDDCTERLVDEATTPKYDGGTPEVDPDDDEAVAFLERALREAVEMLASNHADVAGRLKPTVEDYDAVIDMLDEAGVERVEARQNGWHAPKVTVWLADSRPPMWANDASRASFKFSVEREHYNGRPAYAIIDVRPF